MDFPTAVGKIKVQPEDFIVAEQLHFSPDGEGEHLLLNIRRKGMTTAEVVRRLAKLSGVQQRNISFSGTKDKHAVAEQWFSVWLPGKTFDTSTLTSANLELLAEGRHRKKLKRGVHQSNRFTLVVRDIEGDLADINARLESIREKGYANYFGIQRFGNNNSNLKAADACTDIDALGRQQRGFVLSSIRAKIFNEILAARLRQDENLAIETGDLAMFSDGGSSFFKVETVDESIKARDAGKKIVPTGPLWGLGGSAAEHSIAVLENSIAKQFEGYIKLLEQAKMSSDRRALKVYPQDLAWRWLGKQTLRLEFTLPKSAYATSLIDNIVNTGDDG